MTTRYDDKRKIYPTVAFYGYFTEAQKNAVKKAVGDDGILHDGSYDQFVISSCFGGFTWKMLSWNNEKPFLLFSALLAELELYKKSQ